jgi:uncharacterized protein (DUF1330 family)
MPAYIVAIREAVNDPAEMAIYGEKVGATLNNINVTVRAANGKVRSLEGDALEAAVILEFPTFEEAEAWYDSPAYQEAAQHRFRGATFRTFITDGI